MEAETRATFWTPLDWLVQNQNVTFIGGRYSTFAEDIAMGIDDIINKAKDLLGSEQGEQISDTVLDKASGLANDVTGGKFEGQIDGVRDTIDGAIGNEGK